jgi:hypothetical protein
MRQETKEASSRCATPLIREHSRPRFVGYTFPATGPFAKSFRNVAHDFQPVPGIYKLERVSCIGH